MQEVNLDYIKCRNPKCRNHFGISEGVAQKYCNKDCQWEDKDMTPEERRKWLHRNDVAPNHVSLERMARSGTLARFELGKEWKRGESGIGSAGPDQKTEKRKMPAIVEKEKRIQFIEPGSLKDKDDFIEKTKKELTKSVLNGKNEIQAERKNGDNGMQKTEVTTLQKKNSEESAVIPLEESTQLSKKLNEESVGSVNLLNQQMNQLMSLSKRLSESLMDEEGNVVRKPAHHEVDIILKCFESARVTAKTKLDYLKFAKDISK